MESSFPSPPVAAAAAVDQRKVTEGKMHIEKALGNIWCRRQSRLYHPPVEKKNWCREIWTDLTTPVHISQHRVHIKNADGGTPLASTVRR